MAIHVTCASCARSYHLKDEFAGRTFRCKSCQEPVRVPYPEDADDDFVEQVRRQKRKRSTKSRSRSGLPNGLLIGGAVGAVVLGGLMMIVLVGVRAALKDVPRQERNDLTAIPEQVDLNVPDAGPPDQLFSIASYPMPTFPELGSPSTVPGSSVQTYEVKFSDRQRILQPGFNMQLRVYLPSGDHAPASMPLVVVAPAGTPLFVGNHLDTSGYHDETLPYAEAGACVISYSLDGGVHDLNSASDTVISVSYGQFRQAAAGLVNARIAIEYALAKIPAVDPARIISSGHSSAGTLSVLLAEHEPRLRACIAHCPCTNVERRCKDVVSMLGDHPGFPGIREFFQKSSPLNHVDKIQCPVFLFHAFDDENVPYSESQAFRQQLMQAGKACILSVPPAMGGHYQPMIDEGIPRSITWLKEQSILP